VKRFVQIWQNDLQNRFTIGVGRFCKSSRFIQIWQNDLQNRFTKSFIISFFLQEGKMTRNTVLFVLTAIMLMLGGCAAIVEQELLDRPIVKCKGMMMKSSSLFESTPVFDFKVENPNPLSLKIRNIAYNFNVDDKKFIKGVTDKGILLKSVSSETVGLSITFNLLEIFRYTEGFLQTDKMAYSLSGTVGVGPFAVPYCIEGKIASPNLPDVSLKQLDISGLSLTEPSAALCVIALENTNDFPIQLDGLEYHIRLDGKDFAAGMVKPASPIEARDILNIDIPVKICFSEPEWSAGDVLKKTSSFYDLSGKMIFHIPEAGEKKIPFQKIGEVPFHK